MRALIDTCVLSEVKKSNGDQNVKDAIRLIPADHLFISVISIGEIIKGIELLRASKRKTDLRRWVDTLELNYAKSILGIDAEVARIWGVMTADLQKRGITLPISDGLIAATAKRRGLALMTRNVSDFENTGVEIINPWKL